MSTFCVGANAQFKIESIVKDSSRLSCINPFGGFLNKTSLADLQVKLYKDKYNIITGSAESSLDVVRTALIQ